MAVGTSWWEGHLLTFDLETTGIDVRTAGMVSAAALLLSPENEIERGFARIVQPSVPIESEAAEVHGITQSDAEKIGLPLHYALERIWELFETAYAAEIPLVIYNARFDLSLLLMETKRSALPIGRIPPIIDPLVIDRALDKYRKGGRKLEAVAAHYNIELDNAHAAEADAIASAKIARKLPLHHYPLANYTLFELQDMQTKWHERWKRGLNAWWKKKGIPKEIPASEVWPSEILDELT
jgi:DNA polymerase III subunit epsilon